MSDEKKIPAWHDGINSLAVKNEIKLRRQLKQANERGDEEAAKVLRGWLPSEK